MKIYNNNPFNHYSQLNLIAARIAGVEFTEVFIAFDDQKKPEFLKINPTGKVPCAETPEGTIFESGAIARYIARLHPEKGLYGSTVYESGLVDQWVDFVATGMPSSLATITYQTAGRQESNAATYSQAIKDVREQLTIIEKHLQKSGSNYLVGNTITIADIKLIVAVGSLFRIVLDEGSRKAFPALTKYIGEHTKRPEFREFMGNFKFAKKMLKPPVPKKEEKKEEKKVEKKKEAKDEEEDPTEEKKKPSKLLSLPPTQFDLYNYKTFFVNHLNKREAIQDLWKQFDANGFSLWKLHYDKAEGEGELLYKTNNLVGGFLQRLDNDFRRFSLGVHGIYGEEPKLEVIGCYLVRGTDLPEEFVDHPSFEYYKSTKLDHTKAEDKKIFEDYLCANEDDLVEGRRYREGKYWK